jgi:hypothetical protein
MASMNSLLKAVVHSTSKVLVVLAVALTSQALFAQGVHINLRSNMNPSPGAYQYSDVVAEGNFAYVSSWHNTVGVWIFDVSNPDAPVFVGKYAPATTSKNMQGIQVLNGIGYFADDSGGGIHLVDLSNPSQPRLIKRITSTQGGYNSVHDLTLDGNGHMFVPNYRVNDDVQVWNVSNPAAPFLQMTLQGTDSNTVHDVTVKGNLLIMAGWNGQSDIWDIANLDTEGATKLGSFQSGLHTQDCSLTDDLTFLVCPRELSTNGDVGIFNISDPTNVVKVATITQPDWGISATSPSTSKIMGNLLFVAWYQNGLAVFDITDPTNPILVGNYDTWPGYSFGGNGGGDGDWGVWPFLGSDRVLISDRNTGLYILDASNVSSQPAAFSLAFNPASLVGSNSTTGTAYIVGLSPWPSGITLNLSSDNAAVNPSPVFIPAGAHSATFTQGTSSVASTSTVTVTESDGTYNANGTLTLLPPALTSVSASPTPIRGGLNTIGKVTFNAPAAANTAVSLAIVSGGAAVASMPSSVVVPAGFSNTTWTIQTNQVTVSTKVTFSAAANGLKKTGSFTVSPIIPTSLGFVPSSVTGGSSTTGTVGFPAPLNQDTVVSLTVVSGAGAVASIPANVTVTAGNSRASFTVVTNPVGAKTTVKVSAKANGGAKTATFTVN